MRDIYSRTDRRAYWSYVRICLAVQAAPMSALHFSLLTDKSVCKSVQSWKRRELGIKTRGAKADYQARAYRVGDVMVAHIAELNKQGARPGWVIGDLRDGLVGPVRNVRSQTDTYSRERRPCPPSRRLCKSCQTLLSADRFSHNGKPSGRNICKTCDTLKRTERRKNKIATRQSQPVPAMPDF